MITRESVHVAVVTSGCVTKCVIIGTTTIGAGGDWFPQLLGWGANNALVPNFLAVVFKKQEISQQVVTRMQDLASEFSKIFRG